MLEALQGILKNEIMYYVIVPIIIPLFSWIKNRFDAREKNIKMGYWKINPKRGYSFHDIALKTYVFMLINMLIMQLLRFASSFWIEEIYSYMIFGIIYVTLNIVIVICILKQAKTKIELLKDEGIKKVLLLILCFIYCIAFFERLLAEYKHIMESLFCIVLIGWWFVLFHYTDMVFILDKTYADIYVNGAEAIKFINAGSIRKKGGWIYAYRFVEGYEEEIRIKESEIVWIDYYGDPFIYIQNNKSKKK